MASFQGCGTPGPTPEEAERMEAAIRRWRVENGVQAGGTIKVAFHVITGSGEGSVTDRQIEEQIRALNLSYAPAGFRFELAGVDRTDNAQWFRMAPLTAREKQAKQALAVDPAHRLNIYTCAPGRDLLGWAYLPFFGNESQHLHGVVVHHGALPNGAGAGHGRGATVVHEVGHYLGLLHTLDAGMTELTVGQAERMSAIVAVYRPSLLNASPAAEAGREILAETSSPADLTRGIEFRGAFPNPFRSETAIRFTLPRSERVSLRVYSLTGQLVRTLMDAQLPAGSHSALFSGRDLPSGTYYVALRVGRGLMTRSAVLVR